MNLLSKAAALVAAAAFAASPLAAQDKKADKPPMDEKAAMEMMQKIATPGAGHKKLDAWVGSWTSKTTVWMDPTKDPVKTDGSSELKWALGGRYVQQNYEGQFMGGPFSGIGYTGYDNYKKKYVSTWMDTASTGMMWSTGSFEGKALSTKATVNDPMSGKATPVDQKLTIADNDHLTLEMFGKGPDGKMFKMMEIQYTRKK